LEQHGKGMLRLIMASGGVRMNDVSLTRHVADNVRVLRAQRRWSARQLAERCAQAGSGSLTRGAIAKIESGGRKHVTADELAVLAEVLEVSPSVLLAPPHVGSAAAPGGDPHQEAIATSMPPRRWDDYPPVATQTLPRDIASFTGRGQQLDRLMEAASDAGSSSGIAWVQAIGGMAGVGKTALAVHAAHQLADVFPDGRIFLGLHGHTPGLRPVDPGSALSILLRTAGLPPEQIPLGLEERAALWRDRLSNRRVLLVLDDAASSTQVQPLLPSSPGSLVLITSRRRLSALEDAQNISLDTLPPDDAASLLIRLAGRPALEADDPAVRELAQMCDYLPLAVGIVGRQLRHRPAWTAANLAAAQASARDRLELLTAGDLTLTAALGMSYEQLTEPQRQLFRRIGLHPGADFDVHAAAALDGSDIVIAGRVLDALYDQYFLSEPAPGRYRLHDLVREYARNLVAHDPAGESNPAITRLLGYYQHAAAAAERHLTRRGRPGSSSASTAVAMRAFPGFENREQALSWARTERANLLACVDLAAQEGLHEFVVSLVAATTSLQRQDGPWDTAIAQHVSAVQAARHLGDRLGEANALNDLGIVRRLVGDYPGASQDLQSALVAYRELGDRLGEANVLSDLGIVRRLVGDYPGASQDLQSALVAYREFGDRLGEANVLSDLGSVAYLVGDYAGASQDLQSALVAYRELDDLLGNARALTYLGFVQQKTGDYAGAAASLVAALGIYRDFSYRLGEATALASLGGVQQKTGDYAGAAASLVAALGIYRDLGDRGGEAEVLNQTGMLHRSRSDIPQAEACHRQALDLAREITSPWDEANALAGLAGCAVMTGRIGDARNALRNALDIHQKLGAAEAAILDSELRSLAGA
jgi:tetratricopeptide (TPR) repeat protein/transcriptional regulator with XRE-family HTH domain